MYEAHEPEEPLWRIRRRRRKKRAMRIAVVVDALLAILAGVLIAMLVLGITGPREAVAETVAAAETPPEAAGGPTTDETATDEEDTIETAEVVETASEPVTEAATEADETEPETEFLGMFTLTAYCSCPKCCGKWSGGPTASGAMPEEGRTIATDPRVVPLGTHVIIGGHEYIAEDTGSGIKGKHIDIYFDSHAAALEFGRQEAEVRIKK